MSYGLSGAEKKPLFGGSSSSSSNPPQDGPNAFPGQESLGAVQQQHQQQGAPQRTGQCCDCFSKCSTNCARRLLDGLGALNGLLIIMVGGDDRNWLGAQLSYLWLLWFWHRNMCKLLLLLCVDGRHSSVLHCLSGWHSVSC